MTGRSPGLWEGFPQAPFPWFEQKFPQPDFLGTQTAGLRGHWARTTSLSPVDGPEIPSRSQDCLAGLIYLLGGYSKRKGVQVVHFFVHDLDDMTIRRGMKELL